MSDHSISVETLLGVAAVAAAILVCVPIASAEDPGQTDDRTTTTTTEKPSEPDPELPSKPSDHAASGGLFSGTYSVEPHGSIVHVSSNCPGCDATMVGKAAATMTWDGAGYVRSWVDPSCGAVTTLLTPTVVANGFIQVLAISAAGSCIGPVSGTWTRIGG